MQQLPLNLSFSPSYDPADFIESACNKDVLHMIKTWREWTSYGLCVVGGKNTGKTHLSAVFHAEIPTACAMESGDLRRRKIFDIEANHIILDDAEHVSDETAFFHLMNLVLQRKGVIFMTAQKPPSEWKIRLPDLKSRLCSLPVVRLLEADDFLLKNLIPKLCLDRQLKLEPDVLDYMFKHLTADMSLIYRCVAQLEAFSITEKKLVSKNLFRQVLFQNPKMMNDYAKQRFLGLF